MMKVCREWLILGVVGCALTIGCTQEEPTGIDPTDTSDAADASDTTEPADAADAADADVPDRTDEVYERTRLLDVKIEMTPADWEAMRNQTRTTGDLGITGDCLPSTEPIASPFTWFTGRAIVDGEVIQGVGVRKKGFIGSLSTDKPSIKIRFDKFVEDQTFLDVKRMTLNNTVQDGSFVHQCLAYDLFRAVGVPAPRCNFARVSVNGNDLGLYVNVESIKKPFIRRHFEDDDGNLYEGTLSDFREDWMGTFNQKTNENSPSKESINKIAQALQLPDDQLVDELSKHINFDEFLNFWVVETLTAHWDGYSGNTNNYSIYEDPTSGKVHFIPWGTDQTFVIQYMLFEGQVAPRSINAAGLMTRRLYLSEQGQALYLERLLAVLDAYWDVDALQASIDQMVEVFTPVILPGRMGEFEQGLQETRDFIVSQLDGIRNEVETGPQPWVAGLRANVCGGVVSGTEGGSEPEPMGVEWQGVIGLSETSGELTYTRNSADERCAFGAELTGVASVEDCGEGCTFAREMTVSNLVIEDEASSNCNADELPINGQTILHAQSNVLLGEFDGTPFYTLWEDVEGSWETVEGAYSIVFGDLESGGWYFGVNAD
jgi:hypothetical protein